MDRVSLVSEIVNDRSSEDDPTERLGTSFLNRRLNSGLSFSPSLVLGSFGGRKRVLVLYKNNKKLRKSGHRNPLVCKHLQFYPKSYVGTLEINVSCLKVSKRRFVDSVGIRKHQGTIL